MLLSFFAHINMKRKPSTLRVHFSWRFRRKTNSCNLFLLFYIFKITTNCPLFLYFFPLLGVLYFTACQYSQKQAQIISKFSKTPRGTPIRIFRYCEEKKLKNRDIPLCIKFFDTTNFKKHPRIALTFFGCVALL